MQDAKFRKLIDFSPSHILEAGVGDFAHCRSTPFFRKSDVWMFEPVFEYYTELRERLRTTPRVHLYPAALWHDNHGVVLNVVSEKMHSYCSGATPRTSAFPVIRSVHWPSMCISKIDRGQFDLVMLDMEGAEWSVFKHLVSRPRLISVEWLSKTERNWRHPNYSEISNWLRDNNYANVGNNGVDAYFRRM